MLKFKLYYGVAGLDSGNVVLIQDLLILILYPLILILDLVLLVLSSDFLVSLCRFWTAWCGLWTWLEYFILLVLVFGHEGLEPELSGAGSEFHVVGLSSGFGAGFASHHLVLICQHSKL